MIHETAQEPISERWIAAAESAARIAARRRRLAPADAEDLRSELCLKLLRNNGKALETFGSRSSLQTYLVTVADRCVIDWRVKALGKWRPSTRARRAGPLAVAVERLVERDGLALNEAAHMVRQVVPNQSAELADAVTELSRRRLRAKRRHIPLSPHMPLLSTERSPLLRLETAQHQVRATRVRTALLAALRQLDPNDHELVARRFLKGESIAAIARSMGLDEKASYRRLEQLLRRLKSALTDRGISPMDARAVLTASGAAFEGADPGLWR